MRHQQDCQFFGAETLKSTHRPPAQVIVTWTRSLTPSTATSTRSTRNRMIRWRSIGVDVRASHKTVAEAVLDASALIAFLRNEPGPDKVAAVLTGSCVSAVNLEETLGKMIQYGKQLEAVPYQIDRLCIPLEIEGEAASRSKKAPCEVWRFVIELVTVIRVVPMTSNRFVFRGPD
jgi:hypothetical protein